MKTYRFVVVAAVTGALSFNALAADGSPAKKGSAAKTEQARRVKPHSHLDDKGVPHSDPDKSAKRDQKKAIRHEHQRDAK